MTPTSAVSNNVLDMSKYSGRRVARGPERPTARESAPSSVSSAPSSGRGSAGRGLFLLAGGITVTLIAWGVLVFIAIEFGRQARTGSGTAWGLLGLATVGAAACLYLTLLLAMKTVEVMQRKPVAAALTEAVAAVPAERLVTGVTAAPSPPPASSPTPSSPSSSSSRSASSRPAPRRARQSEHHSRRAAARTPGKRVKR